MANTIGTAYVQVEPSFEGVVPKIDKEFGGAGKESGNSFMSGFGSVLGTVGKVAAGAAAAAATAVGGIAKSAVSAYAEFEQLEGGAKLLFGSAFETVMQNADNAFAKVQMSANDYLAQANSYATGLKQYLGDDEQAAAQLADKIITAQADVVAATGASQESIQNAFSGIMKNNFTMLDNLQLGIKPTKEGMQEVIDQMNEWNAEQGRTTKYQMGNLADMQSAIVDYVSYVKMAGYAEGEGADTIQGALASTKAAWDNLLTAMGTGDTSKISDSINNLVDTAGKLKDNVMPIVEQALKGISQLISELAPEIAAALPDIITEILPGLLESGVQIIESLGEGILSAFPSLMPTITDVIIQLVQMLMTSAPEFIQCGIQMLGELANGIADALPTLIPMAVDAIVEIANALTDPGNISMLLDAALQIILGLAEGLINALPSLIERIPEIITNIVNALITAIPQLIQGAIQLVMMIVQNLPAIILALIEAIPEIIKGVVTALTENQNIVALIGGFTDLFIAVAAALPEIVMALNDAIPQVITSIVEAFMELGPQLETSFTEIMAGLAPTFEKMSQFAQITWTAIQNIFANVGSWFKKKFEEALKNIKNVFNTIRTFFKQKYDEIVNVFSNIGGAFKSVGSQIVEGIKNGIGGTWESLKNFLSDLCGDLIALAKRILGIESPSKVFRDEVGQWIPAGIAAGIDRGTNDLKKTAESMTSDLLQTSINGTMEMVNSARYPVTNLAERGQSVVINNSIQVDGAQDPEAWTQTFIRTLKREARMA